MVTILKTTYIRYNILRVSYVFGNAPWYQKASNEIVA